MTYLYWYLGIGVSVLVIIFTVHQLTKSKQEQEIADLIAAFDPNREQWWWKPLNNFVMPGLAAAAVVAGWPVALYWKAKEMIEARQPPRTEPPQKKFEVAREHLQRQWTIAEVEAAEVVLDPLSAVPKAPFGHLNPAWEVFKQSIAEGDQLKGFSTVWEAEWRQNELREGYVIMRGDTIGPYFIARLTIISE